MLYITAIKILIPKHNLDHAPGRLRVAGAPEGLDALFLAGRLGAAAGADILHIARDDTRMARLVEALAFFAPETSVLTIPAWDCVPYDRVSPKAEIVSRRIDTLTQLADAAAAGAGWW